MIAMALTLFQKNFLFLYFKKKLIENFHLNN